MHLVITLRTLQYLVVLFKMGQPHQTLLGKKKKKKVILKSHIYLQLLPDFPFTLLTLKGYLHIYCSSKY